ncbi:MAG: response regulator [Bacteroidia bacterium]|nr:response regulator [Bacteroidales bacterium]NCD41053.1 response regulator [Bacteroidia bacterium]MDD2322308.1 response regulator [Bacteroidales bacterium]MDD3010395.1 response regulator [Bacteroidales bacterium]MDD3961246.1 response regulator [Bacteroidales bacterium]
MNTRANSILIVDDNSSNIDLLFHSLNSDYNILVAINGSIALKIAKEKKPDCILLDIAMPGMDGFEVMKKLKEDPQTSGIPVIFVTGKTNYEDRAKGYKLGAVDYITKPFELPEVRSRIHAQIQLNRNTLDMVLIHALFRDLKLLFWRYDPVKKSTEIRGSVAECLGMELGEGSIFSNAYQDLLEEGTRRKRQHILLRMQQEPQEYQFTYKIHLPDKPPMQMIEKGFIAKTEIKITYGYLINITDIKNRLPD